MLGIAIIGCGAIGSKRADAVAKRADCRLVACSDAQVDRAEALAVRTGAQAMRKWQDVIQRQDIDAIIISTTHDALAEITCAAIASRKHVLVEKPAARSVAEIDTVIAAFDHSDVVVRVGFNHRYHRALIKAKEIVDTGALGALMYIRGRYGHGGRLGYEREWRANPLLSGGGELIDQGVHLIDLARWFLGDISEVAGFAHTYFWKMPVEDNGFMVLKTPTAQIAFLHASCTEWKNLFSFEVFGIDGKVEVTGLGGSYGIERITHYQMLPQMGPPDTVSWEYPTQDNSWEVEFASFVEDVAHRRSTGPGLRDARAALDVVRLVYESGDR